MDLRLKTIIQKFITKGFSLQLFFSKEDYDKFINYYKENVNIDFFKEIGDIYTVPVSYIYNADFYHYLVLQDDLETVKFQPELFVNPINKNISDDFLTKWNTCNNTVKRYIITHKNCTDGAGVANIIQWYNNNVLKITPDDGFEIQYLYMDYNSFNFDQVKKLLKDCLVYVGDFSFELGQLEELKEICLDIVVIDHHKKMFDSKVAHLDYVHIDMSKSGALLTWEFFFRTSKYVPYVIKLISDRDLWNFFFKSSSKLLQLLLKEEGYNKIYYYLCFESDKEKYEKELKFNLSNYINALDTKEEKLLEIAKTAIPYTMCGVTLYGLNTKESVSDLLNIVSDHFEKPAFAYWIENETNGIRFSFRNTDLDVDVDLLARLISGGGHALASGSVIVIDDLKLSDFFISKNLNVYYDILDTNTSSLFHTNGVSCDEYVTLSNCKHVVDKLMPSNEVNTFYKNFFKIFTIKRNNQNRLVITTNLDKGKND